MELKNISISDNLLIRLTSEKTGRVAVINLTDLLIKTKDDFGPIVNSVINDWLIENRVIK